ncbi:PIN domain-like protein [Ephemerocybe angulata]|uniref:PIN domain-like protein n=1 Tax=Ephemerocybe angulata TaxID=980116 RepID=A0A8H6HSU9_9AGAR|nr:PIN domain-like protein [Tulosesus angulatus]
MGIPDFWPLISRVGELRSLMEMITFEALKRCSKGQSLPVIGVDASPIMYEAQGAVIRARGNGGSWSRIGRNTECRTLSMHLEQLARLPATIVIVFDGPKRPDLKRGTRTSYKEHYLTKQFRQLNEGFGFHTWTAPGEAEAELASLNKLGAVDFVLTSDSDIFMFGAPHIIRSPQLSKNRDLVETYNLSESSFYSVDSEGISPAGAVLVAVLSGGDYSGKGLENCGIKTAWALMKTDLGPGLFEILNGQDPGHLQTHANLVGWRNQLCRELRYSPHLKSHRPELASKVPETFPSSRVVDLYVNPVTSLSEFSTEHPDDYYVAPIWDVAFPDLVKIAKIACQLFDWDWERTLEFLRDFVWPGEFEMVMLICYVLLTGPAWTGHIVCCLD